MQNAPTFFVFSLLFFSFVVPTATAEENVRLMVEWRGPVSHSISDRAPREYWVNGERRRAADLRRWKVMEVPASEVQAVQQALAENPAVAGVHEEQVYQTAAIPNDPRFLEQIGLNTETWPLDINAPEAWERTTGSGNTVIAIIDGGVDLTHEDLRDKLWTNANGDHGWDFVLMRPAQIGIDHGTHVAGIAAASGNNGLGVAGVDWGARIMSVRVLGPGGFGGESNIISGINYAVANGADIINLSIAGASSQAMLDAVENAYAAGVVVVAAAGNSGTNTDRVPVMPGCADVNGVNMVLGVGALDDEGEPASFSNYGKCVDVSAPGKDILSTKVGDRYGTMKGTSMSSPFVAGVAGLYLSLHPNASPAEVISAITGNMTAFLGEKADSWTQNYKGRLNAAGVVGPVKSPDGDHGVSSEPSSEQGSVTESSPDNHEASSGGGGDSGSGGGSSSASGEATEDSAKTPRVAGVKKVVISLSDRQAVDFIQNKNVPAVVARLFQGVWGRKITPQESTYWKTRARSDKVTETKLRGAMAWWKLKGKTYNRPIDLLGKYQIASLPSP